MKNKKESSMEKEWYNTKKWKVGDRYWIYEDGQKLWGTVVNIAENGDCIVEWDNCITTNEGKRPEPASDYFKYGRSLL